MATSDKHLYIKKFPSVLTLMQLTKWYENVYAV